MPVLEGALLGFSAHRHSLEGTCWFILHNFKGCHCWVSAWAVPAILSLQCWLLPLPRSLRYQGLWEALQGSFLEQLQWFRRGCWLTAHISKAGVDGTKLYLNLLRLSCSGWNIFLWWRRGLIDYSLFLNLGALEQGAERKRWEWTGVQEDFYPPQCMKWWFWDGSSPAGEAHTRHLSSCNNSEAGKGTKHSPNRLKNYNYLLGQCLSPRIDTGMYFELQDSLLSQAWVIPISRARCRMLQSELQPPALWCSQHSEIRSL